MRIDYRIFEEITLCRTRDYTISMDNQIERDQAPHIHVARRNNRIASVSIYDEKALAGRIPREIRRDLEFWIDRNRSKLLADWDAMKHGRVRSSIEYQFG